jgi:hypothetical protein
VSAIIGAELLAACDIEGTATKGDGCGGTAVKLAHQRSKFEDIGRSQIQQGLCSILMDNCHEVGLPLAPLSMSLSSSHGSASLGGTQSKQYSSWTLQNLSKSRTPASTTRKQRRRSGAHCRLLRLWGTSDRCHNLPKLRLYDLCLFDSPSLS